jgi:hypothetical protein
MRRPAFALALSPLLLLSACATKPPESPPTAICPPSRGWQVWIDAMPGPRAQLGLIATGDVDIPAGMVARLRPGPTDRMMPPGQRFVLEVKPGRGPSGPQQVRGVAKPALGQYREVIITCGGNLLARKDGADIETAD